MTERRDDEREKSFREEKRRPEERERRSDALKEAWRRNHPSELEEGPGRQKKGDREAHRRQSRLTATARGHYLRAPRRGGQQDVTRPPFPQPTRRAGLAGSFGNRGDARVRDGRPRGTLLAGPRLAYNL
jgi:hypothetical protein